MAKITLNDIANSFSSSSAATYNDNNTEIEAAFENTLSRDGTSPNSMEASLDMNSNRIINLPVPVNVNDAARLKDVQDAALGSNSAVPFYEIVDEEATVTVEDTQYPPGHALRYGAVGDGVTDDTAAVQMALNVGMQGYKVFFPKGYTFIVRQMNVRAGMDIDSDGAILKLAANQPSFQRIFTTEASANQHNSVSDSEILQINGLQFDGNRESQGA